MAIYRKNRGRITTYLASEGVKIPNINITKGVKDRAYDQNGITWSYEPATDNFGREIFVLLRNGEPKRKSERSTDEAFDFMYVTSKEAAQAALAKRSGQIGLGKVERAGSSWRKGREANLKKGLRSGHTSKGGLLPGSKKSKAKGKGKGRASSRPSVVASGDAQASFDALSKANQKKATKLAKDGKYMLFCRMLGLKPSQDCSSVYNSLKGGKKSNPGRRGRGKITFYDLY